MSSGKWTVNGEAITLDHSGRPENGHHRFVACKESGSAFISYVIWLPEEVKRVFDTIDQGLSRGPGDILAMVGVEHYGQMAATVRLVMRYEETQRSKLLTVGAQWWEGINVGQEIEKRYLKDRKLFDLIMKDVLIFRKEFCKLLPIKCVAFVHFFAYQKDEQKARSFLKSLATGEHLAPTNPTSSSETD